MKAYGTVEVKLHTFLNSALDGGERSATRPGPVCPAEKTPIAVDLRAALTFCVERLHGLPTCSLVTTLTELSRLTHSRIYIYILLLNTLLGN